MGVSYYAYAVIGVKIDPKRLYVERTVKAFPHDHPESMKFDPQTGKPLWRVEQVPAPGVEERKGDTYVAGYRVLFGTDHKAAYIALDFTRTGSSNCGDPEGYSGIAHLDLLGAGEKMAEKLKPLGLWRSADFGLWAVLYCSY